jgi:RNA polymerase sigma-70 factor (ECF subfamily)
MSAKVDPMVLEGEADEAGTRLGSVPSFRELFDAHGPYIWRTLRRLGVREADAKDMCQEVFVVVHRRLPDFDGTASVRTWVYGIAVRVASQYRRRAVHRHEELSDQIPEIVSTPPQDDTLYGKWLLERLNAALDRLDENQRVVFVLYELEELTMTEIASALGCPLQTAYSRLRVARETVRKAFRSIKDEGRAT